MFYSFAKAATPGVGVNLLGGKGHSLHTMKHIGMPVPPGFVIGTNWCKNYEAHPVVCMGSVMQAVPDFLSQLMSPTSDILPLLSVRSGAPVSMPGMMDTILNVGLTTELLPVWTDRLGKRAALDCYRRLIQMMGATAYGVPAEGFEDILSKARTKEGVTDDKQLSEGMLEDVIIGFSALFKLHTGENFPDTVDGQLKAAIEAVFRSWMNPRAITYRKLNNISDEIGTAIVIQAMVFGNANDNSGSGVLFSRDPSNGGPFKPVGEFLPNAQGEDVVAGVRTPLNFDDMEKTWPEAWAKLIDITKKLEDHYKDMVDIEFTVQDGVVYMLQCRPGKRAAKAGVEIAYALYQEDKIHIDEVGRRLKKIDLDKVTVRQVDPSFTETPRYIGIGATSGVVSGMCALTAEEAEKSEIPTILVRAETDPDDIGGMAAAAGVLTRVGGQTSHASVVCRGMNKVCIVGCTDLPEDLSVLKGHRITLDASTGRVWVDVDVPVVGGEANSTLANIAAIGSWITSGPSIPYTPDAKSGAWAVSAAELAKMSSDQTTSLADSLVPGTTLLLDFRPESCPDDSELEALWQPAPQYGYDLLDDFTAAIGQADVCQRITVLGPPDLLVKAKNIHCRVPEVANSVMELLESGNLEMSEFVEKKIGGKAVAKKLREVLIKAGFKNKSLAQVAPWQYVLREWLSSLEGV